MLAIPITPACCRYTSSMDKEWFSLHIYCIYTVLHMIVLLFDRSVNMPVRIRTRPKFTRIIPCQSQEIPWVEVCSVFKNIVSSLQRTDYNGQQKRSPVLARRAVQLSQTFAAARGKIFLKLSTLSRWPTSRIFVQMYFAIKASLCIS